MLAQSGNRIHGSNIAANQHYLYGFRHSIGYAAPGSEALFPMTDQHLIREQSVRTSTMPGYFRCSAIEPNPHLFTAFTASMSQKARLGTLYRSQVQWDAVEYAAFELVRNHLERDRWWLLHTVCTYKNALPQCLKGRIFFALWNSSTIWSSPHRHQQHLCLELEP